MNDQPGGGDGPGERNNPSRSGRKAPAQGPTGSGRSSPPEQPTPEPGIGDILGEDRTQNYIRYNIGIFLIVGLGFGLAFLLLDAFASANGGEEIGGGEFLIFGFIIVFILGPFLAAITGTVTGLQLPDSEKVVGITAGVGTFIGFIVLVFVIVIFGSAIGGEVDEVSGEFIDDLLGVIGFGIGVAVTGAGTGYLTKRFM